jgi:hypothetical protein
LIEKIKNGTAPWIYKIYPQKEVFNPFLSDGNNTTIDDH